MDQQDFCEPERRKEKYPQMMNYTSTNYVELDLLIKGNNNFAMDWSESLVKKLNIWGE